MANAPRFDIYGLIHKALRAAMGETLTAVGRMDALDVDDTAAALARVRTVLTLARAHLEHENDFVHTALEARRAGSSARTVQDHEQHATSIAALEAQVERVERASGPARMEAASRLYRALALFVAGNFEHMHVEETQNNQALWAAYSDAELIAIQDALVASIAPQEMAEVMRWMVPSATPFERAVLLGDVQRKVPAEAFSAVLDIVRPHLAGRDWDKLMHALAPLPLAA
jgi:hemerythrin-like domain-containing protein